MGRAEKIIEIDCLLENLLKKQKEGGMLRIKILFFAKLYENLTVSMIVDKLGIKKANFTIITTQLCEEGCIELKRSSLDKRCKIIEVTEKGQKELDNFVRAIETKLGASDVRVDDSLETLRKYLNHII